MIFKIKSLLMDGPCILAVWHLSTPRISNDYTAGKKVQNETKTRKKIQF